MNVLSVKSAFAKVPDSLKALGVVKFERFRYYRPEFDNVEGYVTMRGYELYTMKSLRRDYEEWRKERTSPKKWQDLVEDDAEDKEWAEKYAKEQFRRYKRELRTYNTLVKWAKSNQGVGKDFYDRVKLGKPLYNNRHYGMRVLTTSDIAKGIIEAKLDRMATQMEECARTEFVKLPPKVWEGILNAPRLPSWVVVDEIGSQPPTR